MAGSTNICKDRGIQPLQTVLDFPCLLKGTFLSLGTTTAQAQPPFPQESSCEVMALDPKSQLSGKQDLTPSPPESMRAASSLAKDSTVKIQNTQSTWLKPRAMLTAGTWASPLPLPPTDSRSGMGSRSQAAQPALVPSAPAGCQPGPAAADKEQPQNSAGAGEGWERHGWRASPSFQQQ